MDSRGEGVSSTPPPPSASAAKGGQREKSDESLSANVESGEEVQNVEQDGKTTANENAGEEQTGESDEDELSNHPDVTEEEQCQPLINTEMSRKKNYAEVARDAPDLDVGDAAAKIDQAKKDLHYRCRENDLKGAKKAADTLHNAGLLFHEMKEEFTNTPLHTATIVNATDCATWLLEQVTEETKKLVLTCYEGDLKGLSPLHFALSHGNKEIVQRMFEILDDNDEDKQRLLSCECSGKDEATWSFPLALAASVATTDAQRKIVGLLLDHGADPEAMDSSGATVFHHLAVASVKTGEEAVATLCYILEHPKVTWRKYQTRRTNCQTDKKLLCQKNNAGLSALAVAVKSGSGAFARALLDWDDVYTFPVYKCGPQSCCHYDVTELDSLDHGTDNVLHHLAQTPSNALVQLTSSPFIQALLQHKWKVYRPWFYAWWLVHFLAAVFFTVAALLPCSAQEATPGGARVANYTIGSGSGNKTPSCDIGGKTITRLFLYLLVSCLAAVYLLLDLRHVINQMAPGVHKAPTERATVSEGKPPAEESQPLMTPGTSNGTDNKEQETSFTEAPEVKASGKRGVDVAGGEQAGNESAISEGNIPPGNHGDEAGEMPAASQSSCWARWRHRSILKTGYHFLLVTFYVFVFLSTIACFVRVFAVDSGATWRDFHKVSDTLGLVAAWIFMLFFFRSLKNVGIFTTMIPRMIKRDLFPFLAINSVLLVAFTFGMVRLSHGTDPSGSTETPMNANTFFPAFISFFYLLTGLDSIDPETAYHLSTFLQVVVGLLVGSFIILTYILLFNMLIASMNDTYREVTDLKKELLLQQRLLAVLFLESRLPSSWRPDHGFKAETRNGDQLLLLTTEKYDPNHPLSRKRFGD